MNFDAIVPGLTAIFNTISGLPLPTAQAEDQSFYFPQIGSGTTTDANGNPVGTGTNPQAKLTWDILGVDALGVDELRTTYDPSVRIPGDIYAGPGAPLGGVIYEVCGNRELGVQVKIECFDQSAGNSASKYLKQVRTKIRLPTIHDALSALDLSVQTIGKSTSADYVDDSGRRVSVMLCEITFNASDTATDDPITTVETITPAGTRPNQIPNVTVNT